MDLTTNIPLSAVSVNPKNPRTISEKEFKRLVRSLKKDPEIMTVRPLVVHSRQQLTLLAGEQRFKALQELGYTEIPHTWLLFADTLSEAQREKFILLDNDHAGEWDLHKFTQDWDISVITQDWELSIPGLDQPVIMPELLDVAPTAPPDNKPEKPSATGDQYSVFEVVMEHDKKLHLLQIINQAKQEHGFEKLADALYHIAISYSHINQHS